MEIITYFNFFVAATIKNKFNQPMGVLSVKQTDCDSNLRNFITAQFPSLSNDHQRKQIPL